MRILVTGGSGFIGSAFIRHALAAGHRIALLSRRPQSPTGVESLVGSLKEPPCRAIEDFAPEACVHAAWNTTSGLNFDSSENYALVDESLAFYTRLSALGVKHFVALGTCLECHPSAHLLRESDLATNPPTIYASCKAELRSRLEMSAGQGGMAAMAWARIFNAYGEGEHPSRLCSRLITTLRKGQTVDIKMPKTVRDFIWVDDVATALLAIVNKRVSGAVNVGTGEGTSIWALACRIAGLLSRADLLKFSSEQPSDQPDGLVADGARLRALGWRPQIDLEAGLRRLVNGISRSTGVRL